MDVAPRGQRRDVHDDLIGREARVVRIALQDERIAILVSRSRRSGGGRYMIKAQGNAGGIDLLMFGNADSPSQPACAQPLAKRSGQAVAGIGENGAEANARSHQPVDFIKRDFRLAARPTKRFGDAGSDQAKSKRHRAPQC